MKLAELRSSVAILLVEGPRRAWCHLAPWHRWYLRGRQLSVLKKVICARCGCIWVMNADYPNRALPWDENFARLWHETAT